MGGNRLVVHHKNIAIFPRALELIASPEPNMVQGKPSSPAPHGVQGEKVIKHSYILGYTTRIARTGDASLPLIFSGRQKRVYLPAGTSLR